MPGAYLRIVYAPIFGTGKFFAEEIFLSTEKKLSARTFSPKNISAWRPGEKNHRKKIFPVEICATRTSGDIRGWKSGLLIHIVEAKWKH
jgi:hypothetical protein